MAFMLALVFIFEIVNREVESITQPQEGIIGARQRDDSEPTPQIPGHSDVPQQQGHNVALPHEVTENGQPLSEVYAEVTGMALALNPWIPITCF